MTKNTSNSASITSPSDFARDTIKRMAVERIAPTPENYTRIYNEIAKVPEIKSLETLMKGMLKDIPRDNVESMKWSGALEKFINDANAAPLTSLVESTINTKATQSKAWPNAIRDLLAEWEKKHSSVTPKYKKETLDRLLNNFGNDPTLPEKLLTMTKSWVQQQVVAATESVELVAEVVEIIPEKRAIVSLVDEVKPIEKVQASALKTNMIGETLVDKGINDFQANFDVLQDLLSQAFNYGLIPRLDGDEDLKYGATELFSRIKRTNKIEEWRDFAIELKGLLTKVDLFNHDEKDLKTSLLSLLRLLIDNIGELMTDDKSMSGQIAAMKTILSSPLEKSMILDVEKSLKEVIYKQGALKHSLTDAKESFKHMIAVFIERLGSLSDSTGQYHGKIGMYAAELVGLDDITQINSLVENLASDTRLMQTDVLRSHQAIDEQRAIAVTAELKIRELETQLSQLSEKVRIDQLTGVLNRRGLEEAFVQEIARAQRGESNLCVAMLDIDNFKRLNDTYGHEAGDIALKFLADVVKETVRPTDVVARFGGEEFVILLPKSDINEANAAIVRLQRELTKKFFMQKNERLVITFSAGIAVFKADEDQATVLHRADCAMYLAKKMGKNRVMTERDL